ncbi:MAG: hypothetical protein E7163_00585 [Firmicutes bacterium]|nr:hypothetical protein [Bacillota bacterium]
MNHFVLVRIKTNKKNKLLLKLNKINVSIKNIKYEDKYLVFEIINTDIKRIKKYLVSYKIEFIDDTGIYKLRNEIRKNMLFIIGIIFSVIVFLILTNVIVKVNVIHESKEIRELLYDALKEHGVENMTFKKSYDKYEEIIEDIKEKNKDKIEWLEIDVDGMIINVRVEERIITENEKKYNTCHIVAKRSGIIKSIFTERGVAEVKLNQYVKKNDILINGMIKLNEEVKNNVCAEGLVHAEVWYTANASIPLSYTEEISTNKMRYNFMVKTKNDEYVILKSRINEKKVKNIKLFSIFGMNFYIQKEYEVKKIAKNYTEVEALKKITNIIHEKLILKGIQEEDIINEKVLKKNINNGNLDIEMFIALKEQIGVVKYYDIETDSGTSDIKSNKYNNRLN